MPTPRWNPTRFEMVVDGPFDTSMGTAKVKTNATFGYLKAMGNRQGPHALACEYVGSSLAKWFGLPVAEFAILELDEVACYPLPRGARTEAGPAFVSKWVPGRTWGGSRAELEGLVNASDITRLVVFDNWVRNCDRHPPNLETRNPNFANVYLADTDRPDSTKLYAIDHTHCIDCGGDLTARLPSIGNIRDNRIYGLFPEFIPFIDATELAWCRAMLESLDGATVRAITGEIPPEWDVSSAAKSGLEELVLKRAAFMASKIGAGWGVDFWETPGG